MISKILARLKEDFHVPVALLIFAVTTVYHFKTRVDLGPQYVTSILGLYGFLGGHAWINRNNGTDSGQDDGK